MLKLRIAEPSEPVEFQVADEGKITSGLVMPIYTPWDAVKWKSDKLKKGKK